MLGFSLQKLMVLAGVIAAVWYGFKLVGQLDKARKAGGQAKAKGPGGRRFRWPGRGGDDTEPQTVAAQDMVQCPKCKAYVPATLNPPHGCDCTES